MFKNLFLNSKLLCLSALSFAISLCFALQLSNLSNVFKILGVASANLPWLWLAPPLTGLIIQPLVGQLSDDTATRFGKRMPYLIFWGALGIFSFLIFPFITSIFVAFIIFIIVDCSLNGSTEALRALTNDLTKDAQRAQVLFLQGFFSGIGAAVGTSLPYLLHKFFLIFPDKIELYHVPIHLRYSFYLAGSILFIILLVSVKFIKEKIVKKSLLDKSRKKIPLFQRSFKIFNDIFQNIKKMPTKLKMLCYVHSLAWIGIFVFWLYFSTLIAQSIYHVPFNINVDNDKTKYAVELVKSGLDTSFYFSIYQYISIFYALFLYFLPRSLDLKIIHIGSLLIGGIGIVLLGLNQNTNCIMVSMVCVGIMWGSMITIPYIIAMQMLPKGKVGLYLGLFNICITAPQLLCGLFLSPIYIFIFKKHATFLMLFSGLIILFSVFLWRRLIDEKRFVGSLVLSE